MGIEPIADCLQGILAPLEHAPPSQSHGIFFGTRLNVICKPEAQAKVSPRPSTFIYKPEAQAKVSPFRIA
jgi:hypothetical protein